MIVLFGATGFTGELTARALARRGTAAVLAARDGERVAALARELGMQHAVADAARPETLRALVGRGDVLVSTVGPFARLGGAALEAAIAQGAHYLDSTGEAAFIREVFARGDAAGSALLTAFGFDYVPGNLAGALALREAAGRASRLDVGYFLAGHGALASGGTRASGAGMLLDRAHALRGGRHVLEPFARRAMAFPPGRGVSLGGTESLALPRLAPGLRDVTTYLGGAGALRPLSALTRLPGMHGAVRALAARFAPGSTGGPDEATRARVSSQVVAEARDADGALVGRAHLTGPDPYGLTAELLAWGALHIAGVPARGALGPVDAFGLDALREGCAQLGLSDHS